MRHTSGKWVLNETYAEVRNEKAYLIHRGAPKNATPFTKEEKLANARLIAAAPDLLVACKEIFSILPPLWGDRVINGKIKLEINEEVFYQIEAAINKAE